MNGDADMHGRIWGARIGLVVDWQAGRRVDDEKVTSALVSCGCDHCRDQTVQICRELQRVGALS